MTPVALDLSYQHGNLRRGVVTYRNHHHQAADSECYGVLEYSFDVAGKPTAVEQLHRLACAQVYREYQRRLDSVGRAMPRRVSLLARALHAAAFGAAVARRESTYHWFVCTAAPACGSSNHERSAR